MMKRFTNQSNGSQAGRMYNGGAKFCRFALFPLMLLMLLLLPAGMVAQKAASSSKYIATYESSTQTLTFKKLVGETLPENSAWVEDGTTVGAINEKLGNGTIVHIVFDKSFSTYTPTSLLQFFYGLKNLEKITGLEYLNTEKVTDMCNMFASCSSLTSLDVTHFNTANVTDMSRMFSGCSSLTSLDVTNFNTANVTNMRNMFSSCSALLSLDVTNFNTEKVTNMSFMFSDCSSLTSLDVTHFNTANVTNMRNMFSNCSALLSLDVRNFNTANVTDMRNMFSSCSSLTSLDVTNFNTANVTHMGFMFNSCSALLSLDVRNFNTAKVTNMSYMFSGCVVLTSLYLTNFNTAKVTNMRSMFSSCSSLTTIYASSKFVTTQVSNSSFMFFNCEKLKGEEVCTNDKATDKTFAKIEGGYFSGGIPRVKYADGTLTFFLASKETLGENEYELNSGKNLPEWVKKHSLGITKVVFDTSFANARPTSCYKWFWWCDKLKQVEGIKNLNTKEVTDMVDMFCDCRSLSSLDVSGFNTGKVTDMSGMFFECISLKLLDVAKFNTANVKSMSKMFYSCHNLDLLNVTNFNTANVTNMQGMFSGCFALTTIYASDNFVTGQVTDGSNMFSNCTNLKGTTLGYVASKTDYTYANCGTDGYFTPGCGYAEFDNATGTLTFSYKVVKPEGAYDLNVGTTEPGWRTHKNEIKKVVFDASFANARPTSCYYWFYECKNLVNIEGIENLNTEKVTDMTLMFASCSALTSLDVTKFNTANVTTLMSMFSNCSSLKSLDVTNFDTRNVTNMFYMFNNCSGLTSLDVTKFNTAKVRNMYSMFMNCSGLKSLDVTNFDTENVISMAYMFYECSALTSLDLTNFNTAKVMDMCFMFKKCSGLTSLDLTKFNTAEVTDMKQMFHECSALTTIYASDEFVTTKVETGSNMFFNCIKLKGFIEYNKNTDKENYKYANYKTGYFSKLVGKNGDEKIGAAGETLATDNLVLDDDKDFVAYEPFAAKAASYSRKMNAGTTWATLCLPFEVSLDGQNFRAFKLLSADEGTETVELEEIKTSIEAGTPVIIKMKDGATELKFTEADKEIAKDVQTAETADANYKLQGIYTKKEFSKDTDNNCYIVKGAKLMNPAKLLDKTTTESVGSKPFRAYMVDNSSAPAAGARMFSISVGGSTTAIEQLKSTADSKAEYYDLQGRRLQDLQKGVNIVKRGGKTMKVIIK